MAAGDENDLLEQLLAAHPDNRGEIETKLYATIKRHARAALFRKLNESPPDLEEAVTVAAMTQIDTFRRKCKFSTYVDEIARRKAAEYIRSKVSERKVIDEHAIVGEGDDDKDSVPHPRQVMPSVLPQLDNEIAVRQFVSRLSGEDADLLRYKEHGLTSKEIAQAMGSTVEAVDSRWARLKPKLRKFTSPRRK